MSQTHVVARVQDVELTGSLPDVPSIDSAGRRADMVWLLVRLNRTPIGSVMLALPDAGLSRDELATAIQTSHGEIATRHIPGDGAKVHVDGIEPPDAAEVGRRRARALQAGPELTVVVCTRDRPDALRRCLDSLRGQAYPRFRILVADNSTVLGAGTRDVGPDVETIAVRRPGLSHARNAAVAATRGENLAWIDDDEIADEHWLSEIAEAFLDHPEADVISGAVVPAELDTLAQVWFEQFGGHSKGRGFTPAVFSADTAVTQSPLYPLPPFGAGANLATRAGVVESIGGFDPALGAGSPAKGGEDTLALTQVLLAGGMIVYHPAALTRHFHRSDLDGLRRQLIGYGTGLTAAYTSLLVKQPRRLPQLLALTPIALRDIFGASGARVATINDDFPRDLLRANLRGMIVGPAAYLRGRRRMCR